MDQAVFLFDNQYDPVIIDKVFHSIREKTWYHCIQSQIAMMRQHIYDGPITDFIIDSSFNRKWGFPEKTYSLKFDEKFLKKNNRYIMNFFVKGRKTISLKDILEDSHYIYQYTLHIGDYMYMDAQFFQTMDASYILIIPNGEYGLTEEKWNWIRASYDNELYSPNRWALIVRPKVSYAFGNTTPLASINGTKFYLDSLAHRKNYLSENPVTDWKIAISDDANNMSLLRMAVGTLTYENTGRTYLEISQLYSDYVTSRMGNIQVFAYNEDRQMGYSMSPNYIGPTGYLKTAFDEYIAAVNSARFKVVAQDMEDGWEVVDGTDRDFPETTEVCTVGFDESGECWIAIPTKDGIPPVNPHNIRIWEYDPEYDMLGRLVSTNLEAHFPNIYYYTLKSEAPILFIEWFRDSYDAGQDYDDFTKVYRDYIGDSFYFDLSTGNVPAVISNFKPLIADYSDNEFIKNVLLYSTHEYRVMKMREILAETGLHYDDLMNAIAAKNAPYTTTIYQLANLPGMYEKLMAMGEEARIICNTLINPASYDIYIDGVRQDITYCTNDEEGRQYIAFYTASLKPNSVIIIDSYVSDPQIAATVAVKGSFDQSRIYNFPLQYLSANDMVVCLPNGHRIDPMMVDYAINAKEYLIQVPATMVNWDELGIDINDPRIASRVGISPDGKFQSVVFRLLVPEDANVAVLKTLKEDNQAFYTIDDQRILVKYNGLLVTTEGYNETLLGISKFSKKVKVENLAIHISGEIAELNYEALQTNAQEVIQDNLQRDIATNKPIDFEDDGIYEGDVDIYNANVFRMSNRIDLGVTREATIKEFCGADDPNRLLAFSNGILQGANAVEGIIPSRIADDFKITFNGYYPAGAIGQVEYLPFPIERFSFISDDDAQANIAGTGIMVITNTDLVFEDGKRVMNDTLIRVTNQIIKCPKANAIYTVIRMRRDSNLYDFNDVRNQSFMDQLYNESPGFKQNQGIV